MMWRVVFACCILNLLSATSFPLSRRPHTGAIFPRKSRSAESKSEGRQPFYHPYIKQLYEKITYKNGSIIKGNIGNDPITIWSFLDTDLAQEIRHPVHTNVHTPEGSQILINVFDWSSLQNDSSDSRFDLRKAILRLYKDGNFTKECSKATLHAKVFYKHATGNSEFTGVAHHVDLSNGRYWEELDLTEQFKSLWPIPYGGRQVYVTITLKSQCANNRLPIKLYDLKSITKLKLRRKLYDNQPVLCLYLNNDMIEKLARDTTGHVQSIPDSEVLSVSVDRRRAKRGTSRNDCRKADHIVSFKELGLSYVILPLEYNAGKCVGTCDYEHFLHMKREDRYKVNNYANLMAAQAKRRNLPEVTVCCHPGEYDPLMLLVATADGSSVKQRMYHEMRVRDCYCR